jgi:hypothetical protein
MIGNLALGAALTAASVVVHVLGLAALTATMRLLLSRLGLLRNAVLRGIATVATVLGLFCIHAVEVWLWAAAYLAIGAMPGLDVALYFSIATFSTLGYGDVVPPEAWRVLAGIEGMNGFLLIGWSTAYLAAAYVRYGRVRAR